MKSSILIFTALFFGLNNHAQIGINTTTPNAMLDVTSTTNGFLIPRIALTANNVATPVVNPQGGALPVSTLIYNTATVAGVNGVAPGYYYWNGSLWQSFLNNNDWKLNGNTAITTPAIPATYGISTISATETFIGTKDAKDVVIATDNLERLRVQQTSGNVGIGTASPSSKLEILSNTIASTVYAENTNTDLAVRVGVEGKSSTGNFGVGGMFTGSYAGVRGYTDTTALNTSVGVEGNATGAGGLARFGGKFTASGNNSNNYAIHASSFGNSATGANFGGFFYVNGIAGVNIGGYFSATGGTNNHAIIVPSNSGDVGIGTVTPTYKLHVTNSISNVPTAYVENTSSFSGIGIEGKSVGITTGIGGKFTGGAIGVAGIGVSSLGGTSPKGGVFSASTTATTNYGITADASGGVSSNYAGYFTASGNTTTNVGGYFSATGAPFNNYAIIVPPSEGRVGIGTNAPVDQLEVAGGYVRSTGYRCRTGTSGVYPGNTFNINWTGTTAQLWIDTFNIGTFQFTSDRRLKENILKMNDNALSRVMQLKPVSFNYKNIPNTIFTGSNVITEGFIADELQEVIPSAVNGDKRAVNSEGTIQPQTINTAPIISVLTKAIQEQQLILENLQVKNSQLEERLKQLEEKLSK
jgi:Chaperone of endosialidase